MCFCKPVAMKHYDTFAKRLSDVSSVCDASHVDYCMPRHKPIREGSVCMCVCVCASKTYGRIFEGLCVSCLNVMLPVHCLPEASCLV